MINVKRLDNGAGLILPMRATENSAGYDLRSAEDAIIQPVEHKVIGTGFAWEIPPQHFGLVIPRSGMGVKYGMRLRNTVGVIDSDYRGEVLLCVENGGNGPLIIRKGDALAQMVICPLCSYGWVTVHEVGSLTDTERGEGRFGSTGQ